MKKQLLLSIVFILAFLTNSWSQTNPLQPSTNTALTQVPPACLAPNPVVCPSDALRPIPGTPYEYSIAVPTNLGAGADFDYRWFVTQDPNIITTTDGTTTITSNVEAATGTGKFVQSAVDHYNDIDNGINEITITWKSFVHDPAKPVLVVIYVEGDDGCLTNNIEVFEIQPIHAFTLDIANLASDGVIPTTATYESCVSPVESAIYDVPNKTLIMDYGTNYLYFIVNAANFTDSWLPSFQLSNIGGRSSTIEWQYPNLANVATGWNLPSVAVKASAGDGASVGSTGECIIVRVTIDNAKEETIADTPIELAVNGIMNNPETPAADYTDPRFADVHFTDCAQVDFDDKATHILKPRPDLNSTTPDAAGTGVLPSQPKN